MGNKILKRVRPDERGRITLGEVSKSVSSYDVELQEDGKILLIPFIEIPISDVIKLKNYTDNSIISATIKDDPLSFDEYNMSLNWKDIESINFPENKEIKLNLTVDENNEDNSDSWI